MNFDLDDRAQIELPPAARTPPMLARDCSNGSGLTYPDAYHSEKIDVRNWPLSDSGHVQTLDRLLQRTRGKRRADFLKRRNIAGNSNMGKYKILKALGTISVF